MVDIRWMNNPWLLGLVFAILAVEFGYDLRYVMRQSPRDAALEFGLPVLLVSPIVAAFCLIHFRHIHDRNGLVIVYSTTCYVELILTSVTTYALYHWARRDIESGLGEER